MAQIDPAIKNDLDILLNKVNECGKTARALISRGLTPDNVKKAVKRKYGWRVGTYAVLTIFDGIRRIWG